MAGRGSPSNSTFDDHPPGLVILDQAGQVVSATVEATEMLQLSPGEELGLPASVFEVATRTLSQAADGRSAHAQACIQGSGGRWLALHGSHLSQSNQVAVVIEPARGADLAALVSEEHGLTTRERQVATLWARRADAAETGRMLGISPHTVHDHIKAIYSKLDVGSRAELTAKLYSGEMIPPETPAIRRAH